MDADNLATLSKMVEKYPAKLAIEATEYLTKSSTHVKHVARRATQHTGAYWANRPQWWKTPKTTPPNNIPITPQQGQYVKENSQITQPQYHNQTAGQLGYLPPPQMTAQSQERTNPAKKLVLPHLQFGETVETRHFTISEPPNTYDHEEHKERREHRLSTGSEDGKFTSSTNTTAKLRQKRLPTMVR